MGKAWAFSLVLLERVGFTLVRLETLTLLVWCDGRMDDTLFDTPIDTACQR